MPMLFVLLIISLLVIEGCGSSRAGQPSPHVKTDSIRTTPVSKIGEDFRELGVDILASNACGRLVDQIFAISQKGAATAQGAPSPTIGNFMIRNCSARQVDSQHVQISISGIGWQWISRQRERFGADFQLREPVKYQVDLSTTGTVDIAYDQDTHVFTAYFTPVESVDVTFNVKGDVQVESEGLWSSIIGTAASIIGRSPEERARGTIRQKGSRRFRSRVAQGFTIILDLCTGQRYTQFGTYPPGQVPPHASPVKGMNFLANSRAELHSGLILMSGSFETKTDVTAYVEVDSGGPVLAQWFCQYNAEKLAEAYVSGGELPRPEPIHERIARPGEPVSMTAGADLACPVVLVMRPASAKAAPSHCLYRVYSESNGPKPVVKCEKPCTVPVSRKEISI